MPAPTSGTTRHRVGLPALWPYVRDQRWSLMAGTALSLTGAAAYLAQPLLLRSILDGLAQGASMRGEMALLVALLLGTVVVFSVRNYLLQRIAEGVVLGTRLRLAGHLLRLPVAEYDRRRTGDLLSRVGADTTLLRGVVTNSLVQLVTETVILVGAAVMMLVLDPLLAVVTLVAVGGLFGGVAIARLVQGASARAQARVGDMTAALDRAMTNVRTIRAAGAEDRESAAVGRAVRAAYREGLRMARLQALVGSAVGVSFQGGFVLVLAAGGVRVATGTMTLADLVAFVMLLFQLMLPINLAMTAYTQLQAGLGALRRIDEAFALPTETATDQVTAVAMPAPGAPAVELSRVSFAYQGREPVLREVSLTIPYGGFTALVGPSGAGKSTVLALIERFYDTTAGAVRVGGVDVRDQPRTALRAQLGYVEQEAPVLAGTIRENLLLTSPDATDDRLLEVLDTVNLTEIVETHPDGLDAQVGEGGVQLSGGERQRLAIARTLLAAPPILLLDEPTSNLDTRNEHALRRAIKTASANRTLLVVAHRLSTVVDADQIVVLDRGRIVATGTHAELVAADPLYRELTAQMSPTLATANRGGTGVD
jgi:ABC-type multidrug transport system fused ATPase/permease subunit